MSTNTTSVQTAKGSFSIVIINPTILEFFLTFNLLICADLIGFLGIVCNVINILNFTKQGLHDSVNVTLTALAISDIGSLISQLLMNILVSPFWNGVDLQIPSFTLIAVLILYPHGYFIRVSGYITAFAAFERCMCVVLPLKIKTIITRKVVVTVNCCIFIVLLLYLFPIYFVIYLDLKYNTNTNTSVLTVFYRSNAESVLRIAYFTNDLLLPYVSYLILILCTAFITTSLKSQSKWRHSVTIANIPQSTSKAKLVSSRERRTCVMLSTVSAIFVGCLTPTCAMLTAVGVVRELKVGGAYFDLTLLVYSFTSLLETVNCSVNILIYYKMSSRCRENIHQWFPYLRKQSYY